MPVVGPASGVQKIYRNVIIGIDAASKYIIPSQPVYTLPPVLYQFLAR